MCRGDGKESHLLLHLHYKCLFIHWETAGPGYILESNSAGPRPVLGKKAAPAPRRAGAPWWPDGLGAQRRLRSSEARKTPVLGERPGLGSPGRTVSAAPSGAAEQADVALSTLAGGVAWGGGGGGEASARK